MIETRFKKTDIGEIPKDWGSKSLEHISVLITDGAHSSPKESPIGFYMPSVKDMNAYGFDFTNCKIIGEKDYFLLKRQACQPLIGDVLIAKDGSMLKYCFAIKQYMPIVILSSIAIIRPIQDINSSYLAYYFKQNNIVDFVINNYKTGTGVPRIVLKNFAKIPVSIPTKNEQQRIATALSDIDSLLFALNKEIEKKKLIKQGAMQQLLTGKKRLAGFIEPWVKKKIGEIGYTYNGITGKTKEDFGTGRGKYITFLNVLSNPSIDVSILERVNIIPIDNQNEVQKGDFFFNTSSETPEEVGICSVLIEDLTETYLNSFCFGFRVYEKDLIDPQYWAYWFRSNNGRELMISLAQGSTRYNLSKDSFLKSIISIPTLSEQTAIATILSDMNREIEEQEAKRAKYEQVKQGMMQQLLTGKIRLID